MENWINSLSNEQTKEILKKVYTFKSLFETDNNSQNNQLLNLHQQILDKLAVNNPTKETKSSTYLGKIGEQKFEDGKYNSEYIIRNVSKISHSGDFEVEYKGKLIIVDTKNYSKHIPRKEVDKFINDLSENQLANCGLLISYNSPFTGYQDKFSIIYHQNKPILLLSNCAEEDIKFALSILFKLCTKDTIIESTVSIQKLLQQISDISKSRARLKENIDKLQTTYENLFCAERDMINLLKSKTVDMSEITKLHSFNAQMTKNIKFVFSQNWKSMEWLDPKKCIAQIWLDKSIIAKIGRTKLKLFFIKQELDIDINDKTIPSIEKLLKSLTV